MKPMLS